MGYGAPHAEPLSDNIRIEMCRQIRYLKHAEHQQREHQSLSNVPRAHTKIQYSAATKARRPDSYRDSAGTRYIKQRLCRLEDH
jgi:hypothetical protein